MAYALWLQSHFTADVSFFTIGWVGAIQCYGLGLVYVPTNTLTFATLAPAHRTEAAGMFNLIRNAGSSIGVSIVIRSTEWNQIEDCVKQIQSFVQQKKIKIIDRE